jgi:hypothetical protein
VNSQVELLLDRCSQLTLQSISNSEKIEQAKTDFSQQLETAKDQFRDSVSDSVRYFELKASAVLTEVQQNASALKSYEESSHQKLKHIAAQMKQSEEFLYAHILSVEDKTAQIGESLSEKHSQKLAALEQKIDRVLSQVSTIEAENLHFRTLSDSRISSCEKKFQNNLDCSIGNVSKMIESTREDVSALGAKFHQDSLINQKRASAVDLLEVSCQTVAATVASLQGSISRASASQAAFSNQIQSSSNAIQDLKSECLLALVTAKKIEENIESKFQPQIVEMVDRMEALDAQLASLSCGSHQTTRCHKR